MGGLEMKLETGNVKILRLAKRRKSAVFPEGVPIYRETITVNELFDVIKCLRENYFDKQRCRNCAYCKFCEYPLRHNIHYYR
jgi:hypothetical protein